MIGELGTTVVDWRNAALRLGEDLAPDGPSGYYAFTPEQWLEWARDHLPRPKALQTELLDLITLMPDSQTQEIIDYIVELRAIRACHKAEAKKTWFDESEENR